MIKCTEKLDKIFIINIKNNQYKSKNIENLIFWKINLIEEHLQEALSNHIKIEWNKVKKKQKDLKYKIFILN